MEDVTREEIAYYMRRLYSRGLTTSCGGNISGRSSDDSIYITPSGPDKGRMTAASICEVDMNGKLISGEGEPSMETSLHLKIMKKRPDINAVIHAHPPVATAFSAVEKEISTTLTGECRLVLGEITRVPYSTMGSDKLAEEVSSAAARSDVILMENHGPLCAGATLAQAFSRLEVLEEAARMTLITGLLGGAKHLGQVEIDAIDRLLDR